MDTMRCAAILARWSLVCGAGLVLGDGPWALQASGPLFEARFAAGADGFEPFSSDSSVSVAWSEEGGREGSGALSIRE